MNTIEIDCGASFIKGALTREDGSLIEQRRQQAPPVPDKQNILNPVQINRLLVIVEEMIESLARNEREVRLCISNEMHGFLLAYEDGMPYTDYISWQKEYGSVKTDGEAAIDILSHMRYEEEIRKSGMPLRKGLPSCNLLYLKRLGCLERAKGRLYFYTLGDYIIRRFANIQPVCHSSNMAATGMYDLEKGDWNHNLISLICGEKLVFPPKASKKKTYVIEADRNGIKYDIYPAVGDQQAALLGGGLEDSDTVVFNLGTGAQVSVLSETVDFGTGYQIRPYFGRYIKTVPHLPSGRALNVYIRFFEDIFKQFDIPVERDEIWRVLSGVSGHIGKAALICDMSFFENPLTDHSVGSITNIGEFDLCLAGLMNGIFECMINNFILASDRIQQPGKIKKIIFSGGVAEKIEKIRNGIAAYYPEDTEIKVAKDETFAGLHRYGNGELYE